MFQIKNAQMMILSRGNHVPLPARTQEKPRRIMTAYASMHAIDTRANKEVVNVCLCLHWGQKGKQRWLFSCSDFPNLIKFN